MVVSSTNMLVAAAVAALVGIAAGYTSETRVGFRQPLARAGGALASDRGHVGSFLRATSFSFRLRVCNAYPYAAALDVYRNDAEQLTSDSPMPYKVCRDFKTPLQIGDKVEFKVGDASTGTFSVSDLPGEDAILLLVVHRHDTLSTAMSFESHVFAKMEGAQVAIIDTYKGQTRATVRIEDEITGSRPRSEELRYDSVVAVNPGSYHIALFDQKTGKKKTLDSGTESELVAVTRESYVIIRTGVEAQQGESFPEEVVIFPKPALIQSHSRGAMARLAPGLVCLLSLAAIL